tara:strand:+ start:200 stop:742 length:543 start_codon:yes stop_codon:yes gene_type:complete
MVKNNKGFTLVELLIAISIFASLSIVISGIYLAFSKSQARIKASQSLLNDTQYILETISKEIQNNQIDYGNDYPNDCGSSYCQITLIKENGDKSNFTYSDKVIKYYIKLHNQESWNSISLNNILDFEITYFNIYLTPLALSENEQPRVTISMEVENTSEWEIEEIFYKLQNTISSRVYKR